jgi:colanic acid/amylovoran biosynthesis protein
MEYLVPFLCARLYRISMFVAAPSIGPFDAGKPRRIRKWLLQAPKVICVREATSQRYLETIGIRKDVHVTMDLAFMDSVDMAVNEKKLDDYAGLRDFLRAHEKVVGMTISDFKWHVKLGKDLTLAARINDVFHQMIDSLEEKGYGVLLIPQLFGNQDDCDYLRSFSSNRKCALVMREDMDAHFQQYVISKLYAVIGMRYHSNIFSAKMGTPFISIVYEEKMEGFLALSGLTDHGIIIQDLSIEMLEEKFRVLEENHDLMREKLRNDADGWRVNALRTMDLLSLIKQPEIL